MDDKPVILRVINRFNLGGPTFNVAYLSAYLDGYTTILAGGCKDEHEDSSEFIVHSLGLKPIIIRSMRRSINPINDIKSFLELVRLIRKHKPMLVHTHASKAGTLGRMAAWYCGVPVIVHTFHGHVFHSYFAEWKTFIFKRIERFLAKRSTCIIAISTKQKEELSSEHGICAAEKIRVIPLGFDLQRFRENQTEKRAVFRNEYGLEEDEIAVGIIGRLVPIKNHSLLIRAAAALQKKSKCKKIRFFFIGDGESRDSLVAEALDLGLDISYFPNQFRKGYITITSWIKEVDRVVAGLDIVVLTSYNEGTPVSLIEAQAGGKPIISTRVGGVENATSPETAILIPGNDQIALENALIELYENPEKRLKMGELGWASVGKRFDYTRLVHDTRELYDFLLSTKKT